MLKPLFAAALLCAATGCYSASTGQVHVPPITHHELLLASAATPAEPVEELPDFTETAKPFGEAKLSGDPVIDQPLVCALRFMENLEVVKMGGESDSMMIERYAVHFKLTEPQYIFLVNSCQMFDAGILFYVLINTPPQPVPADPPKLGPRDVSFSFTDIFT